MSKKTARRRRRLWDADPHCYWCGQLTVELNLKPYEKPPGNLATLDHLRSRLDVTRGTTLAVSTVLSCLRCNNERAAAEQARLPLHELRRRSGHGVAAMGQSV